MNYNKKKVIRKIQLLEHEIEYYKRVYKHCNKLNELKNRKSVLINQLCVLK